MVDSSTLVFDVPRPQRLSRLLIFVKWLLILPHALILWVFSIFAGLIGWVAWWAILFTGRYPEGMWRTVLSYVRWNTRVGIYTSLLRDEYPPFGEEPYPMYLELAYPQRQSRLLLFFRWLMLIPVYFWLMLIVFWAAIVQLIVFIQILVTGSISESMFDWMVRIMRYVLRINCYAILLTDEYPGFSLD